MEKVSNLRISSSLALPSPLDMQRDLPCTSEQAAFVTDSRQVIHEIIHGRDSRLLFVVGPCSIHDVDAGLKYAQRLGAFSADLSDRLYLLMRVYFEKPRTTVGWKGLIMDPQLNGTCDIPEGLRIARRFLSEVIDLGIPTATELLDPISPQYIADYLCWAAIGARTAESQTHRQMASGLSMPVGFKNTTAGDLQAAVNGIVAATKSQTFLGITEGGKASAVTTSGNPDCQIILRGGSSGPNFSSEYVAAAADLLRAKNLPPSVMIDCSHDNSGKDPDRQPAVLRDVLAQIQAGETAIHAVMLESNLNKGTQSFPRPLDELEYGVSITDACIDWETTETALSDAYETLATRFP
ncbi:MAG: 3-deoxy-7-phosphoheptulonate synthase [Opitutales bacterium]